MVGIASRVEDLKQDLAALVVHGGGDAAMAPGVRGRQHLGGERQQPAGAVGRVSAGDDEPDTAAGALGEVGGQPVGVAGPVLQASVHRPHHHPVPQGGETKVQRGQQVWIPSHALVLPVARHPPRVRGERHVRERMRYRRYRAIGCTLTTCGNATKATRRLVCATSSISNHGPPSPAAREVRTH